MPSEASRKKAEGFVDGIADDVSEIYGSDGRGHWVESLAAALDAAKAEGEKEASAAYKKGYIRGLTEGAERERWECYAAASLAFAQFRGGSPAGIEQRVCEALAARGPMRGPEEGK